MMMHEARSNNDESEATFHASERHTNIETNIETNIITFFPPEGSLLQTIFVKDNIFNPQHSGFYSNNSPFWLEAVPPSATRGRQSRPLADLELEGLGGSSSSTSSRHTSLSVSSFTN